MELMTIESESFELLNSSASSSYIYYCFELNSTIISLNLLIKSNKTPIYKNIQISIPASPNMHVHIYVYFAPKKLKRIYNSNSN